VVGVLVVLFGFFVVIGLLVFIYVVDIIVMLFFILECCGVELE